MKYCDLHIHSICSDGTFSPKEIASIMKAANSAAFALTDHETLDGIKEARLAALSLGMVFVSGIEIACDYNGNELHIIGLFIDESSETLINTLKDQAKRREARNEAICKKLKSIGINVDLANFSDSSIINRSHFAKAICEHGLASTLREAFDRYLDEGRPAYVRSERLSAKDAISAIKAAGGIAILAHLSTYKQADPFKIASELKRFGLDGIEGLYFEYSKDYSKKCIVFAKENGLLISGGSDFHGENKVNAPTVGCRNGEHIPYSVYEELYGYWSRLC